jgi:transglutaminase-like putative cysteine protease
MTWRMSIDHRTVFRYQATVATSYNEARLTPQTTTAQSVVQSRIEVDPPAYMSRYWDYWGTLVDAFDVHVPHTEMVVRGRSVVEQARDLAAPFDDAGWPTLDTAGIQDRFCEFTASSAWVPDDPDIEMVGQALRRESPSPRAAVGVAVDWVRSQLEYQAGTTTVSTSAVEAWRRGQGVCQDFVHLSLAVLRAAGVPARYVSGYLHPHAEPEIGAPVKGQSHAWLEAWVGDWVPFDPTNPGEVAERHVLVARGRDYGDVPPLKGIYSGGPAERSDVTVELTRLA